MNFQNYFNSFFSEIYLLIRKPHGHNNLSNKKNKISNITVSFDVRRYNLWKLKNLFVYI